MQSLPILRVFINSTAEYVVHWLEEEHFNSSTGDQVCELTHDGTTVRFGCPWTRTIKRSGTHGLTYSCQRYVPESDTWLPASKDWATAWVEALAIGDGRTEVSLYRGDHDPLAGQTVLMEVCRLLSLRFPEAEFTLPTVVSVETTTEECWDGLDQTDMDIVRLHRTGQTNKEIGTSVHLKEKTVAKRITKIRRMHPDAIDIRRPDVRERRLAAAGKSGEMAK